MNTVRIWEPTWTIVTALQIEMLLCDRGSNTTSCIPYPLFLLAASKLWTSRLMMTGDIKIHSGGPNGMWEHDPVTLAMMICNVFASCLRKEAWKDLFDWRCTRQKEESDNSATNFCLSLVCPIIPIWILHVELEVSSLLANRMQSSP